MSSHPAEALGSEAPLYTAEVLGELFTGLAPDHVNQKLRERLTTTKVVWNVGPQEHRGRRLDGEPTVHVSRTELLNQGCPNFFSAFFTKGHMR